MTDDVEQRGRQARALMENEMFREACITVEANLIKRWRTSKTAAEREAAHAELAGLDAVVRTIGEVVRRADYERELREQEERKQQGKRPG